MESRERRLSKQQRWDEDAGSDASSSYDAEEPDYSDEDDSRRGRTAVRWEGAIEARFLKALAQSGGVWEAKPKAILGRMGAYQSQLTTIQVKSHLQKHRIKVAAEMQRQGVMPAAPGDAQPPLQAARAVAAQQAAQQRMATAAAAAAAQLQQKAARQKAASEQRAAAPAPSPRGKKARGAGDEGSGQRAAKRAAPAPPSPTPLTPQQQLAPARLELHRVPTPQPLPAGHAYAVPAYAVQYQQYHPVQYAAVHPGMVHHMQPVAYPAPYGMHPAAAAAAAARQPVHHLAVAPRPDVDPAMLMEPAYPQSPLSGGGSSAGTASAWDVLPTPASHGGPPRGAGAAGRAHHAAAAPAASQPHHHHPGGYPGAAAAYHSGSAAAQYGTTHFATRHASMLQLGGPHELAPQPTAPAAFWASAAPTASCSWPDLAALEGSGSAPAALAGGSSAAACPAASSAGAAPPSPAPLLQLGGRGAAAGGAACAAPHQQRSSDSDCADHFAADDDLSDLLGLPADDMAALKPSAAPVAGADPFDGLGLDGGDGDLSWALASGLF